MMIIMSVGETLMNAVDIMSTVKSINYSQFSIKKRKKTKKSIALKLILRITLLHFTEHPYVLQITSLYCTHIMYNAD